MKAPCAARRAIFAKTLVLIGALLLGAAEARAAIVNAGYNSAADVPLVVSGNYTATGITVNFTLNFAPDPGTNLMVVKLTGLGAINGTFVNLAQNQEVSLTFLGQNYDFVANYYGGTGNDLVLQWATTRPLAWGDNFSGQIGNGGTATSNVPVAVTSSDVLSGKKIVGLAPGRDHSLALCADGTVAAWGSNASGQLGNGSGAPSTIPVAVSTSGVLSSKKVVAIAAGAYHSLALCSDGTVVAWGLNSAGQLGNGNTSTSNVPVAVSTAGVLAGQKVVALTAGKYFSAALLASGAVVTWGENTSGQLGNNSTTSSSLPVAVNTSGMFATTTATAIAAGEAHCLALCANGALAAWGVNNDGQLGDGTTKMSKIPNAVTVSGTALAGKTVTAIAAGGLHSLALCNDGSIAAWGDNGDGQLGLGTTSSSSLLAAAVATTGTALAGKTVAAIAAGGIHSLALCSDGALTAWGGNSSGQLGAGNFTLSASAQNVTNSSLFTNERFALPIGTGSNSFHTLATAAAPTEPPRYTTGTLIANGSFELGTSSWSLSDLTSPFNALQVRTNGYSPGFGLFSAAATDGIHAIASGFDGNGPGIIRMAHDVTVTTGEPFLSFDWRAGWDMLNYSGSTKARTFSVAIEPAGGGPVMQRTVLLTAAAHTKNLDTGSQTSVLDLSPWIGTTVRVCLDLLVPESSTGPAFFQLDDVRTVALLPATSNPITNSATAISMEGATLNGLVNPNALLTTVSFEYGTTTAYGCTIAATPSPISGDHDTVVSAPLFGLPPNTVYHYRVKTANSAGVKYGADATFATLPLAPTVSGAGLAGVSPTDAIFHAGVTVSGATTTVTLEYGPTSAYGLSTTAWESPMSASGGVHARISGLTPGATIHFRFKAENAGGIAYSADDNFTTDTLPPGGPTVNTLPALRVNRSSATLVGLANANGSGAGTVDFEFGAATSYGAVASAFPSSVNGGADTVFKGSRGSLTAGTAYHYRARVFGPNGYVFGPDMEFATTAIGFPSASTESATNITATTAVLHGYATADNGPPTIVSFEYGLDTSYGSVATIGGTNTATFFVPVQLSIPISGDAVTYHYRIKAKNNIGTTYGQDMTFTTPDPHEARLYELTFSAGSLSPAFDRAITAYTMSLPFEATSFYITPTASTGIASVTINGVSVNSGGPSLPLALHVGSNVFQIVVTALDGVTQETYTVTVTRTAPVAGNLDLSLNGTGQVTTDILTSYDTATGVVLQPDGRIVLAGYAYNGNEYDFAVARYNPDGTLDPSFNGSGIVTTPIGDGGDLGQGVALQPDGKIVVAGNSYTGSCNAFAMVRYQGDGSLDTTFNGTGKVVTPFASGDAGCSAIALQTDGKIVLVGTAYNGADYDFALARYHADGSPDTAFNGTGTVVTPFGPSDNILTSVALQTDGGIVVGGDINNNGDIDCALARYNPDGSLDASFNGTGVLITSLGAGEDVIRAVKLQSDGKIVAAGTSSSGGTYDFVVLRFNPDGTADTTFNGNGRVFTPIGDDSDIGTDLILQNDGKIVVAGSSYGANGHVWAAVRYHPDGSLDTTFNGTGKSTVDLGTNDQDIRCVALQDDGKIIVVGQANYFEDFAMVRFLGDGPAIAVQQVGGPNLFDGRATVNFGGALPGVSRSITFAIQDTGVADLSGLDISLDGPDYAAFSLTSSPAASVSATGITTFAVRFLPVSVGPKSAMLHIASNVTGNNQSFDINLAGTGFTAGEDWRQAHFNSPDNSGAAADTADPNGNGILNLIEYALDGDPAGNATGRAILPQAIADGTNALQLEFVRYLDRNDITLTVQACDSLDGTWTDLAESVHGAPFTVLAAGATVDESGTGNARSVVAGDLYLPTDPAHPRRFMRLKVTR